MPKKETILVLAAHNDDQVIGAGGTLAKYVKEGKQFITVVFSYGERSHPHLKPEVIIEARKKEAEDCDKILGGSGIIYLNLQEGKFPQEFKDKKIKTKITNIIKKSKPSKIFTHSIDDPHPDHRAIYKLIDDIIKEDKLKCDVYSFDIWNIIKIKHRDKPKLVVDITKTFEKKVKALQVHESQKLAVTSLLWKMYIKDFTNGFNNNCKYAEVFIKLK